MILGLSSPSPQKSCQNSGWVSSSGLGCLQLIGKTSITERRPRKLELNLRKKCKGKPHVGLEINNLAQCPHILQKARLCFQDGEDSRAVMHPARPRRLPPWPSCQLKAKPASFVDLLSAVASPSPANSGSHHVFLFLLSILGLFACLFVLILCFSSLLLLSLIYHCFLLFIVLSFVLFCVLPLFSFSVFFFSSSLPPFPPLFPLFPAVT